MEKRIVIEVEIEDGDRAEETMNRLFNAAVEGVQNPLALGGARYKVLHQRIETIKEGKPKAKK